MALINRSTNNEGGLSAISSITGKQEYLLSTAGALNSTATLAGSAIPASGLTSAAAVQIVDGSGNQITSFGGGTQYANNASVVGPTGTLALGYDGSNVRGLQTTNTGNLILASLPSGSATIGGVELVDSAGTNKAAISAGGAVKVDNSAVTQPISGTVTANAGTGTFSVAGSATGAAPPATAFPLGISGNSGNLRTAQSASIAHGAFDTGLLGVGILANSPSDFKFYELQIDHPSSDALSASGLFGAYVSNFNTVYNGTSWDRLRGDTTNGAWANVKTSVLPTNAAQETGGNLATLAGGVSSSKYQVNNAQIAGNTVSTDVGASGNGTQRVVTANNTGRTLTSTGGSAASSGNNTLVAAGTNKLKVYAFTLSTTSTTSVTCIFQSGASGTELWRVVLQAPTSVSVGANLVVQPPAYIFATASATLLNLNLSSAQTVHWAVSYFDEA